MTEQELTQQEKNIKEYTEDFILNTIKKNSCKDCEMYFYYEYQDLKKFKTKITTNKVLTYGEIKKRFIKEYGFEPSFLMLCYLRIEDTYEDYFKNRFKIK